MRSLGFFSLFIAAHIPLGFSPWWAICALVLSFWSFALTLCRCLSSLSRKADSSLRCGSSSIPLLLVMALMSLSRFFIFVLVRHFSFLCSFFVSLCISSLRLFQMIWGLDLLSLIGVFISLLISLCAHRPMHPIVSRRFLSLRAFSGHVHLPWPIRGASFGAYFTDISQWSVGTAVV